MWMAIERKVIKATTAMMEKTTPAQKKNFSPFSQVLQKSWTYMMWVTSVQRARTPDSPPMAAVHGWLNAMFQTKNAENPISKPNEAYPILIYVLLTPMITK